MKKVYVLFSILFIHDSCSWAPMVRYPGGEPSTRLSRTVDVDFTSSLNTEDSDGVEFDIGSEIPSFEKDTTSEGVLR